MAVYRPTFLEPNNISVDLSSTPTFTAILHGTQMTEYQVFVYKLSDNTLIHDSGVLSFSSTKYDGDPFSYSGMSATPALNGTQLKWKLKVWETSGGNNATSLEIPFYAYTAPTLSVVVPATPLGQKNYIFTATYTQAEGVSIKRWRATLYLRQTDGSYIQTDTNDYSYSGNLAWTIDSFENNAHYRVTYEAETLYNYVVTDTEEFDVAYAQPSITLVATATDLGNNTVSVAWPEPILLQGTASGTTSYVSNFLIPGNYAANIADASSYINFATTFSDIFTLSFIVRFTSAGFTGRFCVIDTDIEIGYNGTAFYYQNGAYIDLILNTLQTSQPYLIVIKNNKIYVNEWSGY